MQIEKIVRSKNSKSRQIPAETGIFLALTLLVIVFSVFNEYFFTPTNFSNILVQSAITIVIASGATIVIATGGIDLSVGSVLSISGIVMAKSMEAGFSIGASILFGIMTGVLIGVLNGFLIGIVKITPLIATLASLSAFRAVAYIITDARPIYGFPIGFRIFATGYIGIIPYAFIFSMLVALFIHLVLRRTSTGRYALAIGGNEEAARLSGINLWKIKIIIYAIAGLCAAVGALILTARLNAAEPLAGSGLEMDAIAAAVIGGASLAGGVASIPGAIIGAILMATLKNGLTLMSVQPYFQQLTIGIVIVVAVFLDKIRKH
jgi:ribose/xylose/arabinose/galactoside ABC-type transport system permease subunit